MGESEISVSQYEAMEKALQRERATTDKLRAKALSHEAEKRTLEMQLASERGEKQILQEELNNANAKVDESCDQKDTKGPGDGELLERLKMMEESWNREKTVSEQAQRKVFAVAKDLETAWEASDVKSKMIAGLKEDLALTKAELEGANKRLEELAPDLTGRWKTSTVKIPKSERERFTDRIAQLSGMVNVRDNELEIKEKERVKANEKIRGMREELEACYDKIKKHQAASILKELKEIPHETSHVLDRAKALACSERAKEYGDPHTSFTCIADAWWVYLCRMPKRQLDGRDVAMMMVIFKALRDCYKRKADNLDDIASYSQCGAWVDIDDKTEEEEVE